MVEYSHWEVCLTVTILSRYCAFITWWQWYFFWKIVSERVKNHTPKEQSEVEHIYEMKIEAFTINEMKETSVKYMEVSYNNVV